HVGPLEKRRLIQHFLVWMSGFGRYAPPFGPPAPNRKGCAGPSISTGYNMGSREKTGSLHYLRGHGRVGENHTDASAGGAAAQDGKDRHRDRGARGAADRHEDPAHPAGFGQPGAEPERRTAALFR